LFHRVELSGLEIGVYVDLVSPSVHCSQCTYQKVIVVRVEQTTLTVMHATKPYDILEHKHRFAAWAASRAASTKTCRFNVLQGKNILEASGLKELLASPDLLPNPTEIDAKHREWRNAAIASAIAKDLTGFSHGTAAKLINVYLKAAFVCAGHENHASVAALHPPIDSLLLDALYEGEVADLTDKWAAARNARWSKFNSEQYEEVIAAIRAAMPGIALWKIEDWWRGYQ
jgi:hypothetical protein